MRRTCPAMIDRNSRGAGLVLRVLGIVLPFAAWFLLLYRERSLTSAAPLAAKVLRVAAAPWGWPYSVFHVAPWTLGVSGLVAVLFVAAMLVRRDWRGAATVLAVSLFFGWLLSTLIGEGD
jgi:hypothetical protein